LSYGRMDVSAQYTPFLAMATTPGMRRARAHAHSIDRRIGRNFIDIKASYSLQSVDTRHTRFSLKRSVSWKDRHA